MSPPLPEGEVREPVDSGSTELVEACRAGQMAFGHLSSVILENGRNHIYFNALRLVIELASLVIHRLIQTGSLGFFMA